MGQTPILTEGCQDAHLSVMSAISPHGDIYYRRQESNYTGGAVVQFSRELLGLTPRKLHLIWDGASIHRSQEVKDWLRTENQEGRVQLTLLPAYSPQLNAAEQVWAWLKGGELKNVCCKTLEELTQKVQQALFCAHRPDRNHSEFLHIQRWFLLKINSRIYRRFSTFLLRGVGHFHLSGN